jgi:Copper transport outer membrane protein, MctB
VIDFRYHLVSIVAVFLALAIGIVLGSTELQGPAYNILNSTTAKLQNELDQASGQRDTAQAQAGADEQYAQAVEPLVLHNLLAGQRLLIVTEPGAPASVVSAISNAASADAGATVTGQIALQPKFFDTSDTTLDGLNTINLDIAQTAGITLDTGTTYQQQAAQVIASEILTRSPGSPASQPTASQATSSQTSQPTGSQLTGSPASVPASSQAASSQPSDQSASSQPAGDQQATNAQTMLTTYAQAGFLTISGQPATPATLVVVVTPQNVPSDGNQDPLDQLLVPVAAELAAKSSATVVAGTSVGSGSGSPIAVLRSSTAANLVSTVDDADFVSGQSVVIQALATLLNDGKPASYGIAANGASAIAPTPVPTPTVSASPSATSSAPGKKKK